jgi:HTH-type transcriptional regulator/antitoxin HigA
MTYNPEKYGKLLSVVLPAVITNDIEYARIESIFNGLMDKGENKLSPEEHRLFELLAGLLESYEKRSFDDSEPVSPKDALRFLMDENDLKQMDLEDIFGSQAVVSKVLSGKRAFSKTHARRLAERFSVRADLFF